MSTNAAAQLAMTVNIWGDFVGATLTFYVPLLWVTIGLLGWLILTRKEATTSSMSANQGRQQ